VKARWLSVISSHYALKMLCQSECLQPLRRSSRSLETGLWWLTGEPVQPCNPPRIRLRCDQVEMRLCALDKNPGITLDQMDAAMCGLFTDCLLNRDLIHEPGVI
jgi:hypothetical protein